MFLNEGRENIQPDKVVVYYVCNIRELISFSFSALLDIKVICWRVHWESIWRGCVDFTATMHTQYKFISMYTHIFIQSTYITLLPFIHLFHMPIYVQIHVVKINITLTFYHYKLHLCCYLCIFKFKYNIWYNNNKSLWYTLNFLWFDYLLYFKT